MPTSFRRADIFFKLVLGILEYGFFSNISSIDTKQFFPKFLKFSIVK